jgi:tetratricopeptide (TPR) repeat protein
VALDDVQWADPTSVQLTEHLVSLADRAALLLVISGRRDRDHASYQLREAAVREFPHRVREVVLEPLAADVDDRLLTALVGEGTLPDDTRARLREAAAGNPFFLEELVRSLQDAGALARHEDGWRFDERVSVPVPETVQKVILARMDRLSSASHDLLTAAAVLGRQFGGPLLEAVCGATPETEASLVELQRLDLLRESRRWPEREYRFKHPLIQETAYRSLLGERRRALHGRAAAAMEASIAAGAEESLPVLARHHREAGDLARAIDRYAQAGDAAARLFAVEEALGHYASALELVESADAAASLVSDLHLRRGRVASEAGRLAEARADFEAALQGARRSGDVGLEGRSLEELGAYLLISGGGMREGSPVLEEALRVAEAAGDVEAQVRVLARLCIGMSNELRFDEASARGERALALARTAGDDALVGRALDGVKMVAAHVGDFDRLDEVIPELEDILRRRGDLWYLQWALLESSFEPAARGRWEEAGARAEEALAVNRRMGGRADEPYFVAALGALHRSRGAYASALELGGRAVELARDLDRGWWTAWSESHLAATLLDLFLVDDALGHLRRGLRAAERTGTRHYVLRCLGLLASAHAMAGDGRESAAAADRAEELLDDVTTPPGRVFLQGGGAVFGVAAARLAGGDPARAERLVEPVLQMAETSRWVEVEAQGALLMGRCTRARDDRGGAERWLERALRGSEAWGLPGIEWRAASALADVLIEDGRVEEARTHLIAARSGVERVAAGLDDPRVGAAFRQGAASVLEGPRRSERGA